MKDQDQEGGDGSANLQAGGSISGNFVVVQHGITEQRAREIYQELFAQNAPSLVDKGSATFAARADQMGTAVVGELANEDPTLLNRFVEPRAQIALLKAQQSYGETGNVDLAPVLAKMVAQLIQSEALSYVELLSRRCIECITNMTARHLNAIAVIAHLTRRWFPYVCTVQGLAGALSEHLSAYFADIPKEPNEYYYLRTLGVGETNQLALDGVSPYVVLRAKHPNAMYDGFRLSELPSSMQSIDLTGHLIQDEGNKDLYYLLPDFANQWLKVKGNFYVESSQPMPEEPTEKELIRFCRDRIISDTELKQRIRDYDPALADFLDTLEQSHALGLNLNPVGLMLAAQEESIRRNETSSYMDFLK